MPVPKGKMPKWMMEEDVVISGMSGRYPESDNVEEFKKNLFDGVNMITEDDRRWKPGMFATQSGSGKLKNIDRFDHQFFEIPGKQANAMDPAQRILLEAVYEAIFDSGYTPFSMSGKNIGVFVGSYGQTYPDPDPINEGHLAKFRGTDLVLNLMATRISFVYNFKGPSFALDNECSSSLCALDEALLSLRSGRCDAAIVAGTNLMIKFLMSAVFSELALSPDDKCKTFDATANGYVRAEAVCVVFLQKASDARRVYATVLHSKTNNDGKKSQGISFPSCEAQKQLLHQVYGELGLNSRCLGYMETHGTGTEVGDPEECKAIDEFICGDRDRPLLVGSVKSNCGHAERCSGLVAVSKILIAMEEGVIPANLHFKIPNPRIPSLIEGRIKVVNKNTPLPAGVVGINNFGYGGNNCHVVLRPCNSPKYEPAGVRDVPRLVLSCGRIEQSVRHILQTAYEKNFSDEAVALLEEASKTSPLKMEYRGYTLLSCTDTGTDDRYRVQHCHGDYRPVWFLYSGMGSQWSTMAKEMMRLEPFAQSIKASAQILKPLGVDLIHLLTTASEDDLDQIVAPFVTIAAVQIALTDLLKLMGVEPQGIVGHSVGELGCAYADGCFSARQMLMAAYWRGKCCEMSELIYGRMAAIGMTWEEAKRKCPDGVFAVCHNSADSVTISGPAEKVQAFVQQLKAENVFAREVKTCNIAFHSKYVEPAARIMRQELLKEIPVPVARSHRWICSSVPEDKWDSQEAKFSSADYFINNLLSPVLFNEAMSHVPSNALIIEIAPHALMKPIVMRMMGQDSQFVGLMDRRQKDNLQYFLKAVGSLYNAGLNPAVRHLYKPVIFPVPRGTPMLNSLVKWDPNVNCQTLNMYKDSELRDGLMIETLKSRTYDYIVDHMLDGRVLFPATGYLWLAWKALARRFLMSPEEFPVVFQDVHFHMASVLPKSGTFVFQVKILESTGAFSILESGSLLVSGTVRKHEDSESGKLSPVLKSGLNEQAEKEETFHLDAYSFYKELRLRGYEYGKAFQGVTQAQSDGLRGKIKWEGKWITFIDAMLQMKFLPLPDRRLLLPTSIRKVKIDPRKAPDTIGEELVVMINLFQEHLICGPVEILGFHGSVAPRNPMQVGSVVLEDYSFVPYLPDSVLSNEEESELSEYINVCSTLCFKSLKHTGWNSVLSSSASVHQQASEDLIQKYLSCEQKEHVLLRLFQKILSEPSILKTQTTDGRSSLKNSTKLQNLTTQTNHFKNENDEDNDDDYDLRNDLVTRLSLNQGVLLDILNILVDNCSMKSDNALEISHLDVVHADILEATKMTPFGFAFNSYTIARTCQKPIPEHQLNLSDASEVNVIQVNPEDLSLPDNMDLLVMRDIFTSHALSLTRHMKTLAASLKEKGFMILAERTAITPAEKAANALYGVEMMSKDENDLEAAFAKEGLSVVSKMKDKGTFVWYLLRKISEADFVEPRIFELNEKADYAWVEELKEVLKEEENERETRKVWVVAENPESGVVGLLNSLRFEYGTNRMRFFFNASLPGDKCPQFQLTDPRIREMVKKDLRSNVYRRNKWGFFGSRRLSQETKKVPSNTSYLTKPDRGGFSALRWTESPIKFWTPTDNSTDVKVNVYYSALNFRDVMIASGKLQATTNQGPMDDQDCRIGFEFSGVEAETGRRVMGIVPCRGLANTVVCPRELLSDVPSDWTLEEASSVPMVYLTAYYALIVRGRLEGSETVLIHAGSGGVGQAAIAICLDLGCRVYTTVGSDEKKGFLLNRFPGLDRENIYNSRTLDFEGDILNKTRGEGVDVVLNSLAEEKLQASLRCLRTNGKFLEIGAYDMLMDNPLGLSHFFKNIEFHGILMTVLMDRQNLKTLITVEKLLADGIKRGVVVPLKTNVFAWDEVEEAFRYLASGKHIGKVTLKIRDEARDKNGSTRHVEQVIPSFPRAYFNPQKSVVVTGGLGGLGFELCHWLVDRGVRHLVISSRTDVKNSYQKFWIQKWKGRGIQVEICNDDITDKCGCKQLLTRTNDMAPVGSIFHLAMVLHDGLFSSLKPEDFIEVCAPKVDVLRNLDYLSRELCHHMDNFCAFSSIVSSKGVPGLSNYSYANSAMERMMERRRAQGFPGQVIQWGAIGEVGVLYEQYSHKVNPLVNMRGLLSQTMESCLSVLDRLLHENLPVSTSFVMSGTTKATIEPKRNLLSHLCAILGIANPETLKPDSSLGSLGVDSLMTVEAKSILEAQYNTVLSVPEILKLTVRQLKELSLHNPDSQASPNPTEEQAHSTEEISQKHTTE